MSCFSFYEWSTAIELAGYTFAGSNDNGIFDTPIFQSMEIDDNSVPIGRLQGEFYVDNSGGAVGQWGVHFFETDSWIVAAAGFNNAVPTDPLPHAILAGTGDYEGIIGTFSTTVVATGPNFIIEHEVCPGEAAPALSACSPAYYEWSTNGTFTTLAGTSLHFGGSNSDTGVFDTPLYSTADVDADGALAVGAAKGHFSAAGDINIGEWNVVLLDQESSSLAASTGFTDSVKIFPNVVTGGTGMFLGAVGTFESVVVAEDPNFVIEWNFCPQEPTVLDECISIYERSGEFTHGDMTFSGLSDAGDFETPMWATLAAAIAADTMPDGVVIGAFYNRKDVNPGDWNFGFLTMDPG